MKALIRSGEREYRVDLERPVSIAAEVSFAADGPRYFGSPAASTRALVLPGFSGEVVTGASCNCSTITLTPHCNGTHTECAGHLTVQALDAFRVIPPGLLPAMLISVTPERAPRGGDRLITPRRLDAAWPEQSRGRSPVRALVIRTLPNRPGKLAHAQLAPPYLSPEAMQWIVERDIEHLIVDLPSVDRMDDGGQLAAHRVFFGLPPGGRELAQVHRAQCTVTELACVPDTVRDGEYLLELQVPAIAGDAVPSRPLLYALEADSS